MKESQNKWAKKLKPKMNWLQSRYGTNKFKKAVPTNDTILEGTKYLINQN
jgi:hypothetical protein